jgi:hypothetical protein
VRITLTGTIRNLSGTDSSLQRTISAGIEVDDPGGDLVIEAANHIQVASPTRAAWQTLFNRGIKSLAISFTVHRQFATAAQAEYMCFEAVINQPMNCTATITFGSGAQAAGTITAQSAELESVQATHIGCLATILYRVRMTRFSLPTIPPFQPT